MYAAQYPDDHPAQRFILERVDLLLARLESLGRQVRDTVARIVGTTVAEAVAEVIRTAIRWLPWRRPSRPRIYDQYGEEVGYDPFDDDPYGPPVVRRPESAPASTRRPWRQWLTIAGQTIIQWVVGRIKNLNWPDRALLIAGASSLLLGGDDDSSGDATSEPSDHRGDPTLD